MKSNTSRTFCFSCSPVLADSRIITSPPPVPPAPAPHPPRTPLRSHVHSIPLPQTTRSPQSAAPSALPPPAPPTSSTRDSPQTASSQNQYADSIPPHVARARSPHAPSATTLSSAPLSPPPIRNAQCSISPTRSDNIPSPGFAAGRLCSAPLSRSDPPAWSPCRVLPRS